MSSQCSFCLSNLKDPVCTPCGHVYCGQCLQDFVANASTDGYSASCPTCRSSFPIVTPETACLPQKFQRYIFPSIRRVYFDGSVADASLNERLEASQREIASLKRENELLMGECERHMGNSRAHALREKDAMAEISMLKRKLVEQQRKAEGDLQEAQENYDHLKRKYVNLKEIMRATQPRPDTSSPPFSEKTVASGYTDISSLISPLFRPSNARIKRKRMD